MSPDRARLAWIDGAKGLAMFLVFYGHVLDAFYNYTDAKALALPGFRLVYAFHVPAFFFLAGFFLRDVEEGALHHLFGRVLRRLLPVAFFSAAFLPIYALEAVTSEFSLVDHLHSAVPAYLMGRPVLDWVTWFVVCLFTAECIHLALGLWLSTPLRRALAAWLAYSAGWALSTDAVAATGLGALLDFWFFREALVAWAFMLLGRVVWEAGAPLRLPAPALAALGTASSVLLVASAFGNRGLDAGAPPVAMVCCAQLGSYPLFALGALAGCAALVAFAKLVPLPGIAWIGRHSLVLMGLNGLFLHFANPRIVWALAPPGSAGSLALVAAGVAAASLLACLPLAWALDRFLPQQVGRPQESGPWLPALDRQSPSRSIS